MHTLNSQGFKDFVKKKFGEIITSKTASNSVNSYFSPIQHSILKKDVYFLIRKEHVIAAFRFRSGPFRSRVHIVLSYTSMNSIRSGLNRTNVRFIWTRRVFNGAFVTYTWWGTCKYGSVSKRKKRLVTSVQN